MTANNSCPCCSDSMLRHLSKQHSYWYCPSCRIEMPLIEGNKIKQLANHKQTINFPASSINAVINHQENRKEIARFHSTI